MKARLYELREDLSAPHTGYTLPEQRILDAATLPMNLDLFRLEDAPATLIASERLAEVARRLGLDGVTFHELPLRHEARSSH